MESRRDSLAEELLELTGTVEAIRFRNEKNQYTVLSLSSEGILVTVVGIFPFVSIGEELRIIGKWDSHPSYGDQFQAETFERFRPATAAAMLKYLSSGSVKGVGPATAARIVETFGDQALQVIQDEPERLAQIKGISIKKAQEISEELQRNYGIRDLIAYLSAFGIAPEEAVLVWKELGESSLMSIQEDPYCLCSEEIGISFEVADQIAASMERLRDDEGRVRAGILYVLRHNLDNGHTCLPADKLCPVAAKQLGVELELVQENLTTLCQRGETICYRLGERDFIFLKKYFVYEDYIAARMLQLLSMAPPPVNAQEKISRVEEREQIQYDPMQRKAIEAALEKGILILTGGPGTGKTATLNGIIRILKESGETVLLAAPTGRAAKRMSELTGEEAKTIHRLLQVDWDERDNPVFTRNERNPLECDCLVVDELSMVDSYVFESMLRALPMTCRLILVGDSDQLPSVGPGNVLGDLIASGAFPTVQLKKIFRQSMDSMIVQNSHRIVRGDMPESCKKQGDFFFLHPKEEEAAQCIVDLCVTRLPKSYGYSPVFDIQVLCPGRKGPMGTENLNLLLREAINPPAEGKSEVKLGGMLFRTGDKVMQVQNNYQLPWTREDGSTGEGVFNGDIGRIIEIDRPGELIFVSVDDKEIQYDFESAAKELELAYAVTVHKSQGNEFPAVVMPVLRTPKQLCYRNLLYTAVTRARNLLILVGETGVVRNMIANNTKTKRYTGLHYFLRWSAEEEERRKNSC